MYIVIIKDMQEFKISTIYNMKQCNGHDSTCITL